MAGKTTKPGTGRDKDSDGDGLSDWAERRLGTNPHERDSDGDSADDGWEVALRSNPLSDHDHHFEGEQYELTTLPRTVDADGDGLSDAEERARGTGENDRDSDGDGLSDQIEVIRGTNPWNKTKDLDDVMQDLIIDEPGANTVPNGPATGVKKPNPLDLDRDGSPDASVDVEVDGNRVALFLGAAQRQIGDKVEYGANVDPGDPDPTTFDSSELVWWAAQQAGVDLPDGSWNQYVHLQEGGGAVSVQQALKTPGALVFAFSSNPAKGIPDQRYVGISLGDGTVLDVTKAGGEVRIVEAGNFYTHAAVIPEMHSGDFVYTEPDDAVSAIPSSDTGSMSGQDVVGMAPVAATPSDESNDSDGHPDDLDEVRAEVAQLLAAPEATEDSRYEPYNEAIAGYVEYSAPESDSYEDPSNDSGYQDTYLSESDGADGYGDLA